MLSEENKAKIIKTGLYKCQPTVKYRGRLHADNLFWCFNWTFKPHFDKNNNLFMVDTYFNDAYIPVTDENFNEFELIFDFNEVSKTICPEEYNDEDVFRVAIDSGGMYCGGKYFIKKTAKRSKEKLVEICESKLNSAKCNVAMYERELAELMNGTHYKLNYK